MASLTLRTGQNPVLYFGTTTLALSSFSWYTAANISKVFEVSANGAGYTSGTPGNSFGVTQLRPGYSYVFITKQTVLVDALLFGRIPVPVLSSVGPTNVAPGDLLNLTGANLDGVAYVLVGGISALINTGSATSTNVAVTIPLLVAAASNVPVVAITAGGYSNVLTTLTVTSASTKLAKPVVNAPTNITSSGATLTWAAVAGADGYRVRLNGGTQFMPGNVTSYALTGLPANTAFSADVQALDSTGAKSSSDYSTAVSGTTLTTGAIAAPANAVTNTAARWMAMDTVVGYDNATDYARNATALSTGAFIQTGRLYVRAPEALTAVGAMQVGVRADGASSRSAGATTSNVSAFPPSPGQRTAVINGGDSITAGQGSVAATTPSVMKNFLVYAGSDIAACTNEGHGGTTIQDFHDTYLPAYLSQIPQLEANYDVIIFVLGWGHNDIFGPTQADMAARKQLYIDAHQQLKAASSKVRIVTRTVTEAFYTGSGAHNARWLDFNQWVKDSQIALGYWELCDIATNPNVNSWTPATAAYWDADKEHFTDLGYTEMAPAVIESVERCRARTTDPSIPAVVTYPLNYTDPALEYIGPGWASDGSSQATSTQNDYLRVVVTQGIKYTIADGANLTNVNVRITVDGAARNPAIPAGGDFSPGNTYYEEHFTDGQSHIIEFRLLSAGRLKVVNGTVTLFATAGTPPLGAPQSLNYTSGALGYSSRENVEGWQDGGSFKYTHSDGDYVDLSFTRGVRFIASTNGVGAGASVTVFVDGMQVKTATITAGQLFYQTYPTDGLTHTLRLQFNGTAAYLIIENGSLVRYT